MRVTANILPQLTRQPPIDRFGLLGLAIWIACGGRLPLKHLFRPGWPGVKQMFQKPSSAFLRQSKSVLLTAVLLPLVSGCLWTRLPACEGLELEMPAGYFCRSERIDLWGERKVTYGRIPERGARERVELFRPREEIIFDK